VHRQINPALADENGRLDAARVATAELAGPALLQTVSGPWSSTVWVAGAISGTEPALLLAPPAGGTPVRPVAGAGWVSPLGPLRLHHFAFDAQPLGIVFEARYWHDARRRGESPPDATWPVVFTPRPPDATLPTR